MLKNLLKNRTLSGVLIGTIITVFLSLGIFTDTFHSLQQHFSDSLYTRNDPSKDIVIIAVDDKSTQPYPEGLGRYSQWTRDNFTQLLTVLEKENAKVITFDFIFSTPTTIVQKTFLRDLADKISTLNNKEKLSKYDDFLTQYKSSLDDPIDEALSVKMHGLNNLILAASLGPDGNSLIRPMLKFSVKAKLGIVNTFLDRTGILRQSTPFFHLNNKTYEDIALASVRQFLGEEEFKKISIPLESDQMNVNFFGDPLSHQIVSFIDVVNKKFPPHFFENKIVLIGSTASKEIHDEYYTPKSNTTPMSGIEFRANEIQTILEQKFLSNQSIPSQILTAALFAIGLTIALNYLNILFSILATLAAIAIYILAAHLFYRGGTILNLIYPPAATILAYLSSWIYKYFIADKNKREITSAFSHYVSPDLVKEISKNPDLVKLGGEKRIVTVFFSDIKDSTAHAEKLAPEAWVSQINEYFTVMEKVIKASGGTLDKFEGDAIMGFWNAPIAQADHVARAYAAALGMQNALKKLHEKWQTESKPLIEIRIGINTGEALVGNFGSTERFDYTVMGDTVNTASRLESSANKTYCTKIIVAGAEPVRADQQLANPSPGTTPPIPNHLASLSENFLLRELDTVLLPGKKEPVKLFELVGLASQSTPELQNTLKIYATALSAYRKKDFPEAIKFFETLKDDKPAQILLARCKSQPPELDAQMVFRILNK